MSDKATRHLLYLIFAGMIVFLSCAQAPAINLPENKFTKGHFTVYYGKDGGFAQQVYLKAEYYYQQILRHLGIQGFRPWEGADKCTIAIFRAQDKLEDETKALPWMCGKALKEERMIATCYKAPKIFERIIPSELTKLLIWEYFGSMDPPLWLTEGMAQYEEAETFDYSYKKLAMKKARSRVNFDLDTLFSISAVPEKKEEADSFRAQAASLVDYLRTLVPPSQFSQFVVGLRKGGTIEEGLSVAFRGKFPKGVSDLEKRWLAYIQTKY